MPNDHPRSVPRSFGRQDARPRRQRVRLVGDFEFAVDELNTYLELAVIRLFPALYKKVAVLAQTPTSYGRNALTRLAVPYADRVFLVADTNEQVPIYGWQMVGGYISNLDLDGLTGTVDLHYYDAYTMPSDDVTDAGIPAVWKPLIVLGALIEALESRQDSGVRGDEPPIGNNVEVPILDRLYQRYDQLRDELAMSLPAVTV